MKALLKSRDRVRAALFLVTWCLSGCTVQPEGVYRDGKRVVAGPLRAIDYYHFDFLDESRISFAWINGPVEIRYCSLSRREGGEGLEDRIFEVDGLVRRERVWKRRQDRTEKRTWKIDEEVYGTNSRSGKFEGYDAFCTHTFQDIWTGISVFLIAPDSAKGTDEWIAGAKRVTVGNNQWLRKDDPPADYSQTLGKWAAPIETWTLPLADGKYWLVMRLGGSTGGDGTAMGINRNPLKYEQVKAVFHQMIESVRIEPLR